MDEMLTSSQNGYHPERKDNKFHWQWPLYFASGCVNLLNYYGNQWVGFLNG